MKKTKNYRFDKIEYARSDGKVIRGRLYLPLDVDTKFKTAVFAHGYAGCYRDLMHYGPRFAEAGLALCLFDFCGGGPLSSSDGSMTEMSVLTEYDDYLTVLREVKKHPQVDEDNVFLMGESQGGYVAALVGSRFPDESKGMVLWYPSVWMRDKVIEYVGDNPNEIINIWGHDLHRMYLEDIKTIDMEMEISKYPKQVFIVQGDQDPIVLPEKTLKTVETFPDAVLKIIVGGGHGFDDELSLEAGNASIDYIRNH